jgi:hypothetical protein
MPLDATDDGAPLIVERGNIEPTGRTVNGSPEVRYVASGQGRYRSHFASCPHAEDFRRNR